MWLLECPGSQEGAKELDLSSRKTGENILKRDPATSGAVSASPRQTERRRVEMTGRKEKKTEKED